MTLCTVQNRCSRVHCDLKVQRSYAKNYENFTNYSFKTIAKTIGAVKSKPKALRHFKVDPVLKLMILFISRLNLCVFIEQTKSYNHSLRTDEDIKIYRNFDSHEFFYLL